MKDQMHIEVTKAVPAIAGTVFSVITLNEMVAVATLIYIVLQAGYLVWKWRREAKGYEKH